MASRATIVDSVRRQIAKGNLHLEEVEGADVVSMTVLRSDGDLAFRLRMTFFPNRVEHEFARAKEFFHDEVTPSDRRKRGTGFHVREGDRSMVSHVQNHLAGLVSRYHCDPPVDEAEADAAIALEGALQELIASSDDPAGRIAEILMDKVSLHEIQDVIQAMNASLGMRPGR